MRWTKTLFKEKLEELYPELILISEFTTLRDYVEVKDKLGIVYKTRGQTLLKNFPSIKSAKDKNYAFIQKAKLIHGDKYDYSKVDYIDSNTKVVIICKEHGEFLQTPAQHINLKYNCPKCSHMWALTKDSWVLCTTNKKCIFYIIHCYNDNEEFIKFGITSQNIETRFFRERDMPYKYDIIFEYSSNGEFIWNLEEFISNIYHKCKYIPELKFGGSTECYNLDIIEDSIKTIKQKINENLW